MADAEERLRAWRAGDVGAAQALLAPHYRAVLRYFELNASWAAQDLTQRTFELCIRQVDEVRSASSMRAYLLGIARRQLAMHLRSLPRTTSFEEDASRGANETRLSTLVVRRKEQLLLLRVLSGLPRGSQMLLILAYWESLTSAEIGAALSLPPGTVRRQLADARALLRKRLEMFDRKLPASVGDDTQFAELMKSLLAYEK
ncbi:MAG: RNA polymerase sigma factor [Nannocystaceae bacterium]|nr:sigma-70 family RNA polymerase sigma factor [bacterium]